MTVKQRLIAFINDTGLNKKRFEREVGLSNGYLDKLTNAPKPDKLKKILDRYPNLDRVWLLTGNGKMLTDVAPDLSKGIPHVIEVKERPAREEPKAETRPRIPAHLAAGTLTGFADPVTAEQCEMQPLIRNFPDYDYTIIVKGNSMEPKYESGDEIAIKKADYIIEWGKDYVLDTQDGVIFKKIYEDGENIRCVSYNHEEYPDFLVPKSIIYGYYKFVGLVRV